jgi:pyruvate,water dikinase
MPTLWLKFPDDMPFPAQPSPEQKQRLEDIFSTTEENSPWNQALRLLRLAPVAGRLIYWHLDAPYFNWSAMAKVISGGAISTVKTEHGAFAFHVSYAPRHLFALLASQWKIARFERRPPTEDKIAESLALGLVLQSLLLRLGRDEKYLATWLAGSADIPPKYLATVKQIQAVQLQRTALSPAWQEIFPHRYGEAPQNLPAYFWDIPPFMAAPEKTAPPAETGVWKGQSVCAGQVTGLAVVATDKTDFAALKAQHKAPLILVFSRARPETTELFGHAAALVFAEGGILSHACTVARERNIPAVTGLGDDFFKQIQSINISWLAVDGGSGTAKVI